MKIQLLAILGIVFFSSFFLQCKSDKKKDTSADNVLLSATNTPKRVICIGQHTTELLVKMGLNNQIVGWSFPDSPTQLKVPMISKQYPSKEKMIALNPDFIFSGFLGAFKKENLGDKESLNKIGIKTYVSYYRTLEGVRAITYLDFFEDVRAIGQTFNVQKIAQNLEDSLKIEFTKAAKFLQNKSKKIKVVVISGIYPSGEILVTGGYDLSTNLINMARGVNIFENIKKQEFITSVEDIVKSNPDIIILKESINDKGAEISKKILLDKPSLKNIEAISKKKFIVLEFSSLFPSLKNIDAYRKIIEGIHSIE